METAGEGGPWGMALLASYMVNKKDGEDLASFLQEQVFHGEKGDSLNPTEEGVKGFDAFIEKYKAGLAAEKAACETL